MPVAKVYVPKVRSRRSSSATSSKASTMSSTGSEAAAQGQTYVLINEVPSGHWGNAGAVYVPWT